MSASVANVARVAAARGSARVNEFRRGSDAGPVRRAAPFRRASTRCRAAAEPDWKTKQREQDALISVEEEAVGGGGGIYTQNPLRRREGSNPTTDIPMRESARDVSDDV